MNYHIIRSGETLEKIAYGYHLDIEEITRINQHISKFQKLVPGTKIKLPEISNELQAELDEVEPFIEDYYPKIEVPVKEEACEKDETKDEESVNEEKKVVKKPNKNPYINYNPYYYPYPNGYNNYYMNYYRSLNNPKKRSR